jgi:osmotically-inducible protein OsmY
MKGATMFASKRSTMAVMSFAAVLSAGACANFGGRPCESEACVEDAKIRAEVSNAINARPSLRFFNLDIQTAHRDVYLLGLVDTNVDRELAGDIARSVAGVEHVYNALELYGNGTH